jgi:hypothetical protein
VVNGTLQAGLTTNSGGTLGGTGTVAGVVSVSGGVIAPGPNAGKLTVGGLNLTAGTYTWELAALKDRSTGVAGTHFDQLVLAGGTGTYGPGGVVALDFGLLPAASRPDQVAPDAFWQTSHAWDLILPAGGATASGTPLLATSTFAAGTFALSTPGNTLVLTFTPVPEPRTVFGLLVGGVAVAGWLRGRLR